MVERELKILPKPLIIKLCSLPDVERRITGPSRLFINVLTSYRWSSPSTRLGLSHRTRKDSLRRTSTWLIRGFKSSGAQASSSQGKFIRKDKFLHFYLSIYLNIYKCMYMCVSVRIHKHIYIYIYTYI